MSLLFPRFAYTPIRCTPAPTSFHREVAPLFSLLDDTFAEVTRAKRQSRKTWNPRFDIKETKEAYQVDAEIPGVDPKDVSVEFVDEHTLSIKGRSERHTERGSKPTTETQAVEGASAEDVTPATETSSVKSHQATVEDEEPANSSAAAESAADTSSTTEAKAEVAKTEEKPQSSEQYWFSERHVGSFQRQFAFPSRVDQEHVKASLKNGLLSILVPKAAAPESRRIDIQ